MCDKSSAVRFADSKSRTFAYPVPTRRDWATFMRPLRGPPLSVMLQIQLNYIEYRALRISQDREAANVGNVGGRNVSTRAEGRRFRHCGIAVIDRNIDSPVWRHRPHVRLNLHHAADVLFAIGPLGVRRCATVGLGLPTKKFRVEILRLFGIVGQKLVPAK